MIKILYLSSAGGDGKVSEQKVGRLPFLSLSAISSWLSSSRSTEHMMLETVNKVAVLFALRNKCSVLNVFEVNMLGTMKGCWLVCSPHGVAFFYAALP